MNVTVIINLESICHSDYLCDSQLVDSCTSHTKYSIVARFLQIKYLSLYIAGFWQVSDVRK